MKISPTDPAPATQDGRRRQGGFTLVEIMVGFVAVALTAAALGSGLSLALRAGQKADEASAVVALARNALVMGAATGRPTRLEHGGLTATVTLAPDPDLGDAPRQGLIAMRITAVIEDAKGERARLETVRLLPGAQ